MATAKTSWENSLFLLVLSSFHLVQLIKYILLQEVAIIQIASIKLELVVL